MTVHVDRRPKVMVVTIDRPECLNALDKSAIHGIGTALTEAESDDEVSVVVITGAGDRAFCAGIDLKALAAANEPPVPTEGPDLGVLLRRTYPKPVIAAVNGAAFGAGFELVLGCDLVVAAPHATFALPEVKWGLVASGCGVQLLARRIPLAPALEIGLTGLPIDAKRASELGLVNKVVPPDDLLQAALHLADVISRNAPLAVRFTKHHMHAFSNADPSAEAAYQAELPSIFASEDAREGAVAFAEKRAPVWLHR
jgi:enoyl-CoA hydratase